MITDWDPMDLLEKVGHPDGEYDPEVERIARRLEEAESPEGATRLLQDVVEQMFDLDFTIEECRTHGEKLLEVSESHRN